MAKPKIVSKTKLIEDFGLEIVRGRGALFIGSGLSSGRGRYPSWNKLLKPLRERAGVPEFTNYPLLAEYIINNLPGRRNEFNQLLLREMQVPEVSPSPTQRILAALPVRDWWTTNYDCLLEATGVGFSVVQKDGQGLRDSDLTRYPRLVKMHGSLWPDLRNEWAADPIISRSDYERYEIDHARIWALLKATFLTQPFLFLGFGFQDPNIELMLRLSRSLDRAGAPKHFAVIARPKRDINSESEDEFERRRQLDEFRIADLDHSGISICLIDDYEENQEIAQALGRRTKEPAVYIGGSFDVRHPPEDDAQVIFARRVGAVLSQIGNVKLRSLAGGSGVQVSEGFAAGRRSTRAYNPADQSFYFRALPNARPPLLEYRTGTAVYTDLAKPELQTHVIDMCRVAVIVRGHHDTAREAGIAVAASIPVIPLPLSGGTAAELYRDHSSTELLGSAHLDEQTLKEWRDLESAVRWEAAFGQLVARFGFFGSSSR